MSGRILRVLILHEWRLRSRRLSTMLVLLLAVAAAWAAIPDLAEGAALISVDGARMLYDSTTMALGSATMIALLFSLAGFYLVRGRMREELRDGTGSVVAATPVGNANFLLGRWLGALAYLCTLLLVVLGTVLVLHAIRGEAPLDLLVYLQMYLLLLVPGAMFAASMALLCDAWAPLMGKGGDILYFILWAAQFALIPISMDSLASQQWNPLLALDFSGIISGALRLQQLYAGQGISLGMAEFDASLAPLLMPAGFWNAGLVAQRLLAGAIAMLPVLPAILLFHRYSPDQVRPGSARRRASPLALANRLLRPLAGLARPLFGLAAGLPGLAGQVIADLALTLVSNPLAVLALLLSLVLSCVLPVGSLAGLSIAIILFWGVLISDLATRDFQADTESMTAAVPGGAARRYWRLLLATLLLGGLFCGVLAVRLAATMPVSAAALLCGVLLFSAAASLLACLTRSARTFLSLFLLTMYLSLQVRGVAGFDLIGATNAASGASVLLQLLAGGLMILIGALFDRRARH